MIPNKKGVFLSRADFLCHRTLQYKVIVPIFKLRKLSNLAMFILSSTPNAAKKPGDRRQRQLRGRRDCGVAAGKYEIIEYAEKA